MEKHATLNAVLERQRSQDFGGHQDVNEFVTVGKRSTTCVIGRRQVSVIRRWGVLIKSPCWQTEWTAQSFGGDVTAENEPQKESLYQSLEILRGGAQTGLNLDLRSSAISCPG